MPFNMALDVYKRQGKEIMIYDKHCLHLGKEEVEKNLAEGKPFVIRQNIPMEGTTTFHDELYGDITVENAELDDICLLYTSRCV